MNNNDIILQELQDGELNVSTALETISESSKHEGIWYTKFKKVLFPIKGLQLQDIPVLESIQLTFYQKYIILVLQKGMIADSIDELCTKISDFLNVSLACVRDFIDYLSDENYLNRAYNEKTKQKVYKLDDSIHFTIDPEYDNAMFAELSEKKADCNKVVFVPNLDKCYLESDFAIDAFRRKGNVNAQINKRLPDGDVTAIYGEHDEIKELIKRYFESTNFHLTKEFDFKLKTDAYTDYFLEFDALIQYSYDRESKKSEKNKVIIANNNILPVDFVETLLSDYQFDDKLPRFIELKESFYDNVAVVDEELSRVEEVVDAVNAELAPAEEKLDGAKSNLSELKKSNKKKKKELEDQIKALEKKLKGTEDSIEVNEKLISETDASETELLNNFKKGVRELTKEKEEIESELKAVKAELSKFDSTIKETEEEAELIVETEKENVGTVKAKVKEAEKDVKEAASAVEKLIDKNTKSLNETIAAVVEKYPSKANLFNRYVSEICIELDKALSASEFNAVDEVAISIDTIREKYRKVLQIVFDTLLQKREMNLGSYFADKFNRIELDNLFKKRGVNVDIKERLILFHDVANAIGHLGENGPKKAENEKRLSDFKKLTHHDRSFIILAVPNFFNSITFTNAEIKSFSSKLKI